VTTASPAPEARQDGGGSRGVLGAIARGTSVLFFVAQVLLAAVAWWCAARLGELQCGPEPPDPHTGLQVLLVAPPVLFVVGAVPLVWRAFSRRTGTAAVVALVATMVGCALGAGSVLFAGLAAMSC
jgi:hypothetical protein